jgi:hypothetical protein
MLTSSKRDTLTMQQRSITTSTFVSGQAQQIFLGFVLGLFDAVADSGIIRAADGLAGSNSVRSVQRGVHCMFLATNTHL